MPMKQQMFCKSEIVHHYPTATWILEKVSLTIAILHVLCGETYLSVGICMGASLNFN